MNLANIEVQQKCTRAALLIYSGQYESAKEELEEFWPSIEEAPNVNYPPEIAAEILLQCGSLTGWLGSSRQIDAQEKAKDLLTQALCLFQGQDNQAKVSETQYELGICYWRTGAFGEARVMFNEALKGATQKGKILITRTVVEISTGKYHEALRMLDEARSSFEDSNHALKGRWHAQMALVLRRLATSENRIEYFDRAIVEYTAAIYHYEEAGHTRYRTTNLNNIAFILYKLGHYREAHEQLDRVYEFKIKDPGIMAQVEETRARVLVAEERYEEASRVITKVVNTLEKGGEQALLADALTIKATVQAKLQDYDQSLYMFRRAINLAENIGAFCNAGRAALSMIEEHGAARLSEREIYQVYRRADKWLTLTQDAEDITRLRTCARIVIRKLFGPDLDEYFTLPEAVLKYEARFIEQALKEEKGSITRAARRLGLSHQTLGAILKTRHQNLCNKRSPEIKRKRSIIKDR
jgi:tetratricopeptide (TPR) repeat protein